MRLRGFLAVPLAAIVLLIWSGCDNTSSVEQFQGPDPSFKVTGPPPEQCDTKKLPVKDYFTDKGEASLVSSLLRDLGAACADQEPGQEQPAVLGSAFQILSLIESARTVDSDYMAGGKIAWAVLRAMYYRGGDMTPCPDCAPYEVEDDISAATMAAALAPGGAFGVRPCDPASDTCNDAVFTQGVPLADAVRWGVETDAVPWDWENPFPGGKDLLPYEKVLIYGSPGASFPGLDEAELPGTFGGFSWYVTPWHAVTTDVSPLLVASCGTPTAGNKSLVAHRTSLLPRGNQPSYCFADDPLLAAGPGQFLTRLASRIIPFWPQPLHATFLGTSDSGKARNFSPFFDYDIAPYAEVTIPALPDGEQGLDVCQISSCDDLIYWTTQTYVSATGEPLGGNPIASKENLLFTTRANSSSWGEVYFCMRPVYADGGLGDEVCGWEPPDPAQQKDPLVISCDAREGLAQTCIGLVVTSFTSNKTGSHRICVENATEGQELASGLLFDACSVTFNIRPAG